MKDYQNELEEDVQIHYSRRYKRKTIVSIRQADEREVETMVGKITIKWAHYVLYLTTSLLIGGLTVSLPLLTDFANGLQVQHLYTGLAVSYGQLPYTNLFATGGFLYYTLIAFFGTFQSRLLLTGLQVLALFVSGIYFEKCLIRLTNREDLGQGLTVIFYLFQLALGFGGLYPIQWATPFLLMGFYYISNYWYGQSEDEVFIGYGLVSGLSLLLDPKTLLFWVWALVLLVIYNLSHKRWTRGFYQFLSLCFGLVLPIYVALYFMINLQVLSPAIKQSVFYSLLVPAWSSDSLLLSLTLLLTGLLLTGLLTGTLGFYSLVKTYGGSRFAYWLLFLTVMSYTLYVLLAQTYWFYPLLYVLPFGLLLSGTWLVKEEEGLRLKMVGLYIRKQWGLPLLAFLILVSYPISQGLLEKPLNEERDQVATFLASQSSVKDNIYVWDKTSRIYLKAERRSASQLSSPVFYTLDKTNATLLEDELLQHRAKYFIWNKGLPLSETLSKALKERYDELTAQKFSHFVIYQLK